MIKTKKSKKRTKQMHHTAYSLFTKNLESVEDTMSLYKGILELKVGLNTDWLLRAAIVFIVSAMDTYFHDRIKYGISRASEKGMPDALSRHRITIGDLENWESSRRRGNVIRNWITDHLASVPLQSPDRIAEYMRYIGIEQLWNKVEPDNLKRNKLLQKLNEIIDRRNKIAHEGDRLSGRSTEKRLRDITVDQVNKWVDFIKLLVRTVDKNAV